MPFPANTAAPTAYNPGVGGRPKYPTVFKRYTPPWTFTATAPASGGSVGGPPKFGGIGVAGKKP